MAEDFLTTLAEQARFSRETFGPGRRKVGIAKHISREIAELMTADDPVLEADEWADLAILAFDGLTRHLGYSIAGDGSEREHETPEAAAALALLRYRDKLKRNYRRQWPDWRSVPNGEPIEHKRETVTGAE